MRQDKQPMQALCGKWHPSCFKYCKIFLKCIWLSIFSYLRFNPFCRLLRVILSLSRRCSECKQTLSSVYFARGNVLYCKKDYSIKFRSTCHACERFITGPVMVRIINLKVINWTPTIKFQPLRVWQIKAWIVVQQYWLSVLYQASLI